MNRHQRTPPKREKSGVSPRREKSLFGGRSWNPVASWKRKQAAARAKAQAQADEVFDQASARGRHMSMEDARDAQQRRESQDAAAARRAFEPATQAHA